MKKIAFVTSGGDTAYTVSCNDDHYEIGSKVGELTCLEIPLDADEESFVVSHYWENEEWKFRGNRPTQFHMWNRDSLSWEDSRDLQYFKEDKMRSVKKDRDLLLQVFTWDNSTFDADTNAKINITGAISRMERKGTPTVVWRLADNSWRELTLEQMYQVLEALEDNVEFCFTKFALLESQVLAAESVEDLENINW